MSAVAHVTPSIEIFFSYAHEDDSLREELDKHLSLFWRLGIARKWHDRQIGAGAEWRGQIDAHLDSAEIILLLISPDFLASDYCYDIEMKRALDRHARGEARVIPILVRHCNWREAPFGELECLPRNGKPVAAWKDRDEAFASIAKDVAAVVDELLDGGDADSPGVANVSLRRSGVRWWISGSVAVLAAAGLVVAGMQSHLFSRAATGQFAGDPILQTKLAFALGSSVAMAGHPSHAAGQRIFDRALADLGLKQEEAVDLGFQYSAIGGFMNAPERSNAQSLLLSLVSDRINGAPAKAVAFGYDVSALRLLLQSWPAAGVDPDGIAAAKDRVAALQISAHGVVLPASVAERIRILRAGDLTDVDYRRETLELLDRALGQFDMPAP